MRRNKKLLLPEWPPRVSDDLVVVSQILQQVNDRISHCDNKATATTAGAGIMAGILYNLVGQRHSLSLAIAATAILCGLFIVGAGLFASISLIPRLRAREAAVSVVYFDHIARRYGHSGALRYRDDLRKMIAHPDGLLDDMALQIVANSVIAYHKYRWINIGILCALLAVAALAVTAALVANSG